MRCSAPPPCPLTSGLSFPGEPRLKARVGKGRRWRPFHPPRPTPPRGRSSSLPPGPHVEPRFPGGPVRAPTRAAGPGGGLGARTRQRSPAIGPGSREGAFSGLGRRLPAGPVDLPRTPQEADAGDSGSAEQPWRVLHKRFHCKAALETAPPATARRATALRLRTRAGQRAPRNYRKASTRGGGASTPALVATARSTPAARASSWDAGNSCSSV